MRRDESSQLELLSLQVAARDAGTAEVKLPSGLPLKDSGASTSAPPEHSAQTMESVGLGRERVHISR
jgi:hypothetical protein